MTETLDSLAGWRRQHRQSTRASLARWQHQISAEIGAGTPEGVTALDVARKMAAEQDAKADAVYAERLQEILAGPKEDDDDER
jgi:beta-galactosidase GanA